jgi:hypothetical protein
MDTKQFIVLLPLLVVGIAALVSLISFYYHYPDALRKLSVLWMVNFLVDLAGHITRHFNLHNHWLYNIYFWAMYLTLAYLYGTQIRSRFVHNCIRVFYMAFPVLITVSSIMTGINRLQTVVVVPGGLFIIFLAAAYFRQLYLSEETASITRDPWFWFSCGLLVYFGGTVPFLGMFNYLWHHHPSFTSFYYFYFSNSFAILLNILIITGFLCRRNYQKSR